MKAVETRRIKTKQLTFAETDAVPEPKLGQANPEFDKAIPTLEKANKNVLLVSSEGRNGEQLYAPLHDRVEKYMANPARTIDVRQYTIDGQSYLQRYPKGTLSPQEATEAQEVAAGNQGAS